MYSIGQISKACFPGDVEAITKRGWVRWDQLKEGDDIGACDENDPTGPIAWKKVEEMFETYAPVLHIHLEGDKVLRTTTEHPIYVLDKDWISANCLQPGDLLRTDKNEWKAVEEVYDTELKR